MGIVDGNRRGANHTYGDPIGGKTMSERPEHSEADYSLRDSLRQVFLAGEQISAQMKRDARAHNAGFHLFGWAFHGGLRKVDPKYPRAKRVWWN